MTLPEEPITAGAKRERVHARFNRPGWSEHGPIGYRGRFWIGSRLIDGPALIELVSGRTDEELVGLLQELAGFYSLLMRFGDTVYLAVDRVRSFPLFYAVQGQDLYVSDDAHWIRKQLGSVPYDLLTSEEFLFTGYVTGRDSLCAPIKQVQAGELVTFQLVEQRWESRTKKYYFYRHNQDFEGDESFFFKMLDEVLAKVFSRFISDANGRTIVIPLSGGYDSRLIAVMLKQFGYKDVITFSYGLPDNQESQISKQVADRLGFCWHFVPYHHEDWRHWFQTEEYRTYSRMADGLCSVPHEQDWPAVWQLAKQAILPADAIFSPGHTADVLSGSRSERVPALYDVRTPVNTALRAILHLHYGLQDWPERFQANSATFHQRILDVTGDLANYQDAASVLEYWEVQERQAKYIVNSVRVYEYWEYSWWLPFWDREYLEFWKRIPLSLRIHQKLYKRYVEKLYGQVAGVSLNLARESEKGTVRHSLGRILRRLPFWQSLRTVLEKTPSWRLAEYDRDPIYGIVPKEVFLSHSAGRSLLAFEALEQLGLLSFDRPNRSE